MGLIAEHHGALGGYEAVQLPPAPAQRGCRGAAMLRRRSARTSKRAVLYLHCLADSFVPEDLASWYTERGFHFYVADLRPQARLDQQAQGRPRPGAPDVSERFGALDAMSAYLRESEAIDTVVVSAHAAGALIAALWCDARREKNPADALILADPAFGRRKRTLMRLRKRVPASKASASNETRGANEIGVASEASAANVTMKSDDASVTGKENSAGSAGPAGDGRLPGLLAGAQRRLRRGLSITCPVLVMCTAAEWDAPGDGRRGKRLKHRAGGHGTIRLGPHVTWLRLEESLTGPLPPGGTESRPFFRELGRWLGAYLSGQFRDQLL